MTPTFYQEETKNKKRNKEKLSVSSNGRKQGLLYDYVINIFFVKILKYFDLWNDLSENISLFPSL